MIITETVTEKTSTQPESEVATETSESQKRILYELENITKNHYERMEVPLNLRI